MANLPNLTDPVFQVRVVRASAPKAEQLVDFSHKVKSLSYEDDEKKTDVLKLTVDNFDLRNFDDPLWKTGNEVEVSWGYPGQLSPVRRVVITKVVGSTELQVEAQDRGVLMHKRQRVRTFDSVKRSDVVRQIAAEAGYGPTQQHIDDTKEVLPHVTQARMTDAQLVRELATREGWEFYIDFDGFHFHPRRLGAKPRRKLVYYTDPGRGDVLDFKIENDIFAKGKAGGGTVEVRDLDKKTTTKIDMSNVGQPDQPSLAPVKELIVGVSKRDGTPSYLQVPEDSDPADPAAAGDLRIGSTEQNAQLAARQAAGLYAKTQMVAVQITLECRGDPDMVAKSIIEVAGIGASLSGNYYITSVSHALSSDYKMTIKARRDGRSQSLDGLPKPPALTKGPVNSQDGPEGDGDADPSLEPVVSVSPDGRRVTQFWDTRRGS